MNHVVDVSKLPDLETQLLQLMLTLVEDFGAQGMLVIDRTVQRVRAGEEADRASAARVGAA